MPDYPLKRLQEIDTDVITENELDLSITPTWTGQHTFDSGLTTKDTFDLEDTTGAGTAVTYDTDASAGVMRTPNAGMRVESDGVASSGEGLELRYSPNKTRKALIQSYDYGASSYRRLSFAGNLYDFSLEPANLRLATGQNIEDGSGNSRLLIGGNQTRLFDEESNVIMEAFGPGGTSYNRIVGRSGQPIQLYDDEGDFTAVQYTTSASAPGTLELTNAVLRADADDGFNHAITVTGGREVLLRSGGGENIGLFCNSNGQLVATNSAGAEEVITSF